MAEAERDAARNSVRTMEEELKRREETLAEHKRQAAEERERSSRRLRDAEDAAKAAEAKANQTYNEDITRLKEAHLQVR